MALEKGDYTIAIVKSLESIEKGKDVPEAVAVLDDAWQRANSDWTAQIATIEKSTTANALAKAIPLYNKLIEIHGLVTEAGRFELKPDKESVIKTALKTQQRVVEMHFKEASANLARGGRDNAREAVLQFRAVKSMAPDYPGLDAVMEQATEQATVKVYISGNSDKNSTFKDLEIQPMVEKQLSDMDFVKVVEPTADQLKGNVAIDIARSLGADILVNFTPDTSYSSDVKTERRPIDSRVSSATNWNVEKSYILTSGKCEISYSVVDVATENILDEGIFSVEDSTDHGFSVSAILWTGKIARVKIGNMYSQQTLLVSNLDTGWDLSTLIRELQNYEKVETAGGNRIVPTNNGNPIDFTQYKTPEQLNAIQELNGHTFALFDIIEDTLLYEGKEQIVYQTLYGSYFGEGFASQLKTAQFDRQVYEELLRWMKLNNTQFYIKKAFLGELAEKTVPNKIVGKISPFLK
jgi:phosphopantetheine adenylyltransferase